VSMMSLDRLSRAFGMPRRLSSATPSQLSSSSAAHSAAYFSAADRVSCLKRKTRLRFIRKLQGAEISRAVTVLTS